MSDLACVLDAEIHHRVLSTHLLHADALVSATYEACIALCEGVLSSLEDDASRGLAAALGITCVTTVQSLLTLAHSHVVSTLSYMRPLDRCDPRLKRSAELLMTRAALQLGGLRSLLRSRRYSLDADGLRRLHRHLQAARSDLLRHAEAARQVAMGLLAGGGEDDAWQEALAD